MAGRRRKTQFWFVSSMPMGATAETAAAQLRRILLALPALADDEPHSLRDVAARAGTDEETLLRDLRTLVTRSTEEPAGFVEPVQLAMDAESVRLDAPGFFRRPMGLSALELESLELGLATLRQETPREEQAVIERARERLRSALSHMPRDAGANGPHAAHFGEETDGRRAVRRAIQRCVAERKVAELEYQGASDAAATPRKVNPLGLVHARGSWYLIAWCQREHGVRVFRLDRIAAARETDESFTPPADFQFDDVLRDGRAVHGEASETLRIRFSPRIARWIEEREEIVLRNEDGSVEVEYPLLSEEWAVRFVLQYGDQAEVVGPERARHRIAITLAVLAG